MKKLFNGQVCTLEFKDPLESGTSGGKMFHLTGRANIDLTGVYIVLVDSKDRYFVPFSNILVIQLGDIYGAE